MKKINKEKTEAEKGHVKFQRNNFILIRTSFEVAGGKKILQPNILPPHSYCQQDL